MNRKLYFCKSWFRAKKHAIEMWTEEQAKAAHDAGQPYTVLVDSKDKPFCFIEVASNVVNVGFLDEFQREHLVYAFREVDKGRLFLSMATYRQFRDSTDNLAMGETYLFKVDGNVEISRTTFEPRKREVAQNVVDVSGNYEAKPAFGEYEQVIRVDR
jgi:hypothetical protein